jgi:hypothetical protein
LEIDKDSGVSEIFAKTVENKEEVTQTDLMYMPRAYCIADPEVKQSLQK